MDPGWLSAGMNGALALIWVVYLTLFYRQLRNYYTIRVFVQQHGGYTLASRCNLTNLSDKPVSLASLQCCLNLGGEERIVDLTGIQGPGGSEGYHPHDVIGAGESLTLGTFEHLLAAVVREAPGIGTEQKLTDDDLETIEAFQLRVAIIHGGSAEPAAVQRTFRVDRGEAGWGIVPDGNTVQFSSRGGRRRAREWIQLDIENRGFIGQSRG